MVMVLPAKAHDLGLFPRTHMVESELLPLTSLRVLCVSTYQINVILFKKCK